MAFLGDVAGDILIDEGALTSGAVTTGDTGVTITDAGSLGPGGTTILDTSLPTAGALTTTQKVAIGVTSGLVVGGVTTGIVAGADPTAFTSYATNYSLGGSDIEEIVKKIKPILESSLTKLSISPSLQDTYLNNAVAYFSQGYTFSNKTELDALVKYVVESVAKYISK